MTTTQTQLEKFREVYPSTRVTVHDDFIVYKVRKGTADKSAKGANELIQQYGLDLTAMATGFPNKDSFWVQSSNTEH